MSRTLPILRFQFAEADREKYGDQWWEFDEAKLTELRARELIALDDELRKELRLNTVTALQSFLAGDTRGSLAVMWLARRLAGVDEPLAEFDPLPMLAQTEIVTEGDAVPPASTSSPSQGSAEA